MPVSASALPEARKALSGAADRLAELLRSVPDTGATIPASGWTVGDAAEPVALLLVRYGRIGQWGPIAKGQLLTWGRPWRALRFKRLFLDP